MENNTEYIWNEFHKHLKLYIIWRIYSKNDADDILQEVFVKIHTNIGKLKEEKKLKSWIYRITRNTIIDYYRKNKSSLVVSDEYMNNLSYEYEPNDQNLKEISKCIKPLIKSIPKKYQQAIEYTEFQGYTQKQLAEELGITTSWAKSRVQRAKTKIKEVLNKCCEIELDRQGGIVDYKSKGEKCNEC